MPGQVPVLTSFRDTDPHQPEQVSTDTLDRCADLLAAGEMDWPAGLTNEQEAELLVATQRHRRARLVKFIASRIAADIAAEVRERAQEAHP
jgi:hypothetical protein